MNNNYIKERKYSPKKSIHVSKTGSVHVDIDKNSPSSLSTISRDSEPPRIYISSSIQNKNKSKNNNKQNNNKREEKRNTSDILKTRLKSVRENLANLKYY